VVRNGHAEPRQVLTSAGALPVRAPRVNDKRVDEATGERQRFSSAILPAWCRKSPKITEVLLLLERVGQVVAKLFGRRFGVVVDVCHFVDPSVGGVAALGGHGAQGCGKHGACTARCAIVAWSSAGRPARFAREMMVVGQHSHAGPARGGRGDPEGEAPAP
jgi:hypothetical protein